jgi:hypothetical protein
VRCGSCGSQNLDKFYTELAIHSHDIRAPLAFVFPKILVCMNCGRLEPAEEMVVPKAELQLLSQRDAAHG